MSKLTKSWLDKTNKPFDSSMLRVGEMMELPDGGVLLRAYIGYVSLNNPNFTWNINLDGDPKFAGRKLQPGESITLIQE